MVSRQELGLPYPFKNQIENITINVSSLAIVLDNGQKLVERGFGG